MKTIYFLTMMQLKDKLDLSEKTKKSYMFNIVFGILKFGLITAVIFLALYLLGRFNWVSLDGQIPVEVLVVLFSVMLILSIITCTIKCMDSLYFGKDNMFLLTLPASKSQLFISKRGDQSRTAGLSGQKSGQLLCSQQYASNAGRGWRRAPA